MDPCTEVYLIAGFLTGYYVYVETRGVRLSQSCVTTAPAAWKSSLPFVITLSLLMRQMSASTGKLTSSTCIIPGLFSYTAGIPIGVEI